MLKKIIIGLISGLLLVSMIGCNGEVADNNNTTQQEEQDDDKEKTQEEYNNEMRSRVLEGEISEEVFVWLSGGFRYDYSFGDRKGQRDIKCTFTNNNPLLVKWVQFTFLDTKTNDIIEARNTTPIGEGETSPNFYTYENIKNANIKDYKLMEVGFIMQGKNNKEIELIVDVENNMFIPAVYELVQ